MIIFGSLPEAAEPLIAQATLVDKDNKKACRSGSTAKNRLGVSHNHSGMATLLVKQGQKSDSLQVRHKVKRRCVSWAIPKKPDMQRLEMGCSWSTCAVH